RTATSAPLLRWARPVPHPQAPHPPHRSPRLPRRRPPPPRRECARARRFFVAAPRVKYAALSSSCSVCASGGSWSQRGRSSFCSVPGLLARSSSPHRRMARAWTRSASGWRAGKRGRRLPPFFKHTCYLGDGLTVDIHPGVPRGASERSERHPLAGGEKFLRIWGACPARARRGREGGHGDWAGAGCGGRGAQARGDESGGGAGAQGALARAMPCRARSRRADPGARSNAARLPNACVRGPASSMQTWVSCLCTSITIYSTAGLLFAAASTACRDFGLNLPRASGGQPLTRSTCSWILSTGEDRRL